MTISSSTEEISECKHCLVSIHKPEDVLNKLGTSNKGLLMAIVSCSFSWGFGALSIMSSAFTSIDCGNCTDVMITVVSEFDLRNERAYLIDWSTSFFMIGNMVGGSTLSHAADRYSNSARREESIGYHATVTREMYGRHTVRGQHLDSIHDFA
ncbi:unnamed protein product [Strongylus vulgaris]|uniref:Major facilitator superfamily (MFS) profile domain-containing protein n=1 Tax=Strongylus vulgaris TaxID=40348 RepID=A0A3P7J6D4_STRVU|nr:unnamed protein product [Strongylus vulgaris]